MLRSVKFFGRVTTVEFGLVENTVGFVLFCTYKNRCVWTDFGDLPEPLNLLATPLPPTPNRGSVTGFFWAVWRLLEDA